MAAHVEPKTKMLSVKFTPEQRRMIDQRARRCGVKTTVWMRSILLQAARTAAAQGYLRIREPDGVIA